MAAEGYDGVPESEDGSHRSDTQGPPEGDTTLTRVFVGGLPWTTESDALHLYFKEFGEIVEAIVIKDRRTGRSKGYGFVTFQDANHAVASTQDPNPIIDGRKANCNLAFLGAKKKKKPVTPPSDESSGARDRDVQPPYAPVDDGVVTFNVGGTKYVTSHRTLNRFPDTLLPQMAQAGEEEYFIDRNARAFEWILDVYRHGYLVDRPDVPRSLMVEELAYFGLSGVGTTPDQRFDLKDLALSVAQQRVAPVVSALLDLCDGLLLEAARAGTRKICLRIAGESPTNVWWCNNADRRAEFPIDCRLDTELGEEHMRDLAKRVISRYGVAEARAVPVPIYSEFRSTDFVPFFYLMGREATGTELTVVFFA